MSPTLEMLTRWVYPAAGDSASPNPESAYSPMANSLAPVAGAVAPDATTGAPLPLLPLAWAS